MKPEKEANKQLKKENIMNLVHYNPHRKLRHSAPESSRFFDGLFDDFFTPFATTGSPLSTSTGNNLSVDIYEKGDTIVIDAELPGVAKEDISVDVKGKLITLGGERKSDEEVKDENCYRRERKYGKFERTFSLPFEVQSETVQATFTNGILKLEIPKPEEQGTKKIAIN